MRYFKTPRYIGVEKLLKKVKCPCKGNVLDVTQRKRLFKPTVDIFEKNSKYRTFEPSDQTDTPFSLAT